MLNWNSMTLASDLDNIDEIFQADEVNGVPSEQGQTFGQRDGGDEQVGEPPARPPPGLPHRRIHPSVRPGCLHPERQGIERGLGPLQPVLSPRAFVAIGSRTRPRGQLSHAHGRNRHLLGKLLWRQAL